MTDYTDLDAVRALCNADLAENRFGYETCVAPNCSCAARRQAMVQAIGSIMIQTMADALIEALEGVKAAARAAAADNGNEPADEEADGFERWRKRQ